MNKLHIFGMMALAAVAFTSCEADDSPKLNEPTEFVLNTPPFANQLYTLTPDGTMEFTCSQPNYGMALATTYTVEVSMLENFGDDLPEPAEGEAPHSVEIAALNPQSAVLVINESRVAEAICAMRGITSEEEYTDIPAHPLYVRVNAAVNNQPSTAITSNVVTLPQVKGYCAFEAVTYDVIYNPGNSNGWNFDNCQQLLAFGEGKYRGFLYLDGEFKFTPAPNWDSDWGAAEGAEGTLAVKGGNIALPATGAGLYYAEVNTTDLTYKLVYLEYVGLAGDLNGWNATDPAEKMETENHVVYTFTSDSFVDGGFKFVFNGPGVDAWKYNLGGTFENLVFDGDNLPSTAGSHTVTLDLRKIPYTASFE